MDDPHDDFGDFGARSERRRALEAKASDYDAARKAIDDASFFVRGLWVTYVTFGVYVLVAVVSVTHRQLFLETPIKLPLLDVQLPLVTFFIVAPGLLVIFHFYILLQIVLLAEKVKHYNALITPVSPDGATRPGGADLSSDDQLRQQLPNDMLVQFLAGPRATRRGVTGAMLRLIAESTMVVAPPLILMVAQLQFLPYQHELATWAHRGALFADLIIIWALWRGVVDTQAVSPSSRFRLSAGVLASVSALGLSLFALTFPGDAMDSTPLARSFHAAATSRADSVSYPEQRWRERFPAAGRLIAGNLRLREESFVEDDKIVRMEARDRELKIKPWEGERTIRLANRRLVGADLSHADLRRANLRGAHLENGYLAAIRLDGAILDHVRAARIDLSEARLPGASLLDVRMPWASMYRAQMNDAHTDRSMLWGADFRAAYLRGASLFMTSLIGASFDHAHLEGAALDVADLKGASLVAASLQSASLFRTQFQAASLDDADLRGATLAMAQGHGASFSNTNLHNAYVNDTIVHRSRGAPTAGFLGQPYSGRHYFENIFSFDHAPLSDRVVQRWRSDWRQAVGFALDDEQKRRVEARFDMLEDKGGDDKIVAQRWSGLQEQFEPKESLNAFLALACEEDAAPYVARGLMRDSVLVAPIMKAAGENTPLIAAAMRSGRTDPSKCRGVSGFVDEDWRRLDKLSAQHAGGTAAPP